jgi:hypothetical protein
MAFEKINIYSIITIIFIFIGIVSLVWGYIIPTAIPINKWVSYGFEITGIIFFIIAAVLFIFIRKKI